MMCLLPGAVCYVFVNCDNLSRDLCKLAVGVMVTALHTVVLQVHVIYAQLQCCLLVTILFAKTVAALRIWGLQ